MSNYPWTDSGLLMLFDIKKFIYSNGGPDILAQKLEAEQVKYFAERQMHRYPIMSHKFSFLDQKFIKENYGKMKHSTICYWIGCTPISLTNKIKYMIRKKIIEKKLSNSIKI